MSYEKDLQIEEYSLEKEWLKQPSLFLKYSEKTAEADSIRKKAKENLDVISAEIDLAIRHEAAEEGEKITEKIVSNRVILNKEYQEALKEVRESDYNYALLIAAVRAMDQKKAALENLVKLLMAGYFSSPSHTEEDKDFTTDASSKGQREALNNKKKKRMRKEN